jgi:hypothetical protein
MCVIKMSTREEMKIKIQKYINQKRKREKENARVRERERKREMK